MTNAKDIVNPYQGDGHFCSDHSAWDFEVRRKKAIFIKEKLIPAIVEAGQSQSKLHGWGIKMKSKSCVRLWMNSDNGVLSFFDVSFTAYAGIREEPMWYMEAHIQHKDAAYWKDCSHLTDYDAYLPCPEGGYEQWKQDLLDYWDNAEVEDVLTAYYNACNRK